MDPDTILSETEDAMAKAADYLQREFRGLRTGRASASLIEYIKVDYYGSATDLKAIAAISVPEATQLLIQPFDASALQEIKKAVENADLGLNPMVEGKQIRINVPALSKERRQHLVNHSKKLGEESKVALRNARRDANKHADALNKQEGKHYPEDEIKVLHGEIQDLLKKYEAQIDSAIAAKAKEIEEI